MPDVGGREGAVEVVAEALRYWGRSADEAHSSARIAVDALSSTGRGDLAAALRRYHEQIAPWVAAGCPADPLPSISSEECVAAEAALFRSAGVLSPGQPSLDREELQDALHAVESLNDAAERLPHETGWLERGKPLAAKLRALSAPRETREGE
jgi:hypothetical protein